MKSSVVITTCNRAEYLLEAIQSLNNQTRCPDEVIVVDDCSDDPNLISKINSLGGLKLRLYRNEKRSGANHSRNVGIRACSSEIVFFLDDDDKFFPTKIDAVMRKFEAHKSVGIVTTGFVKNYVDFNFKKVKVKQDHQGKLSPKSQIIRNVIGGTSMVAAKKDILVDGGLFDEDLPALQDQEFWLRLAKTGVEVFSIHEPLVEYTITSGSTRISNSVDKFWKATKYIEEKHADEFLTLSKTDMCAYKSRKWRLVGVKNLLAARRIDALVCFFRANSIRPNIVDFFFAISIFIPVRFLVRFL